MATVLDTKESAKVFVHLGPAPVAILASPQTPDSPVFYGTHAFRYARQSPPSQGWITASVWLEAEESGVVGLIIRQTQTPDDPVTFPEETLTSHAVYAISDDSVSGDYSLIEGGGNLLAAFPVIGPVALPFPESLDVLFKDKETTPEPPEIPILRIIQPDDLGLCCGCRNCNDRCPNPDWSFTDSGFTRGGHSGSFRSYQNLDANKPWALLEGITEGFGLRLNAEPTGEWCEEWGSDGRPTLTPETYIFIYVDESGSMNAEYPGLRVMFSDLVTRLTDEVFEGDYAKAASRIIYQGIGDERWLKWFATPENYIGIDSQAMLIVFAFINESTPYSNTDHGPSGEFFNDYSELMSVFRAKPNMNGRVFAIGEPEQDVYYVFQQQLHGLFNGTGGFRDYPMPPEFSYEVKVNSNQPAIYYANAIRDYLGLPLLEEDDLAMLPMMLRSVHQYNESPKPGIDRLIDLPLLQQNVEVPDVLFAGQHLFIDLAKQEEEQGEVSYRANLIRLSFISHGQEFPYATPFIDGFLIGASVAQSNAHGQGDFRVDGILFPSAGQNNTAAATTHEGYYALLPANLQREAMGSISAGGELISLDSPIAQRYEEGAGFRFDESILLGVGNRSRESEGAASTFSEWIRFGSTQQQNTYGSADFFHEMIQLSQVQESNSNGSTDTFAERLALPTISQNNAAGSASFEGNSLWFSPITQQEDDIWWLETERFVEAIYLPTSFQDSQHGGNLVGMNQAQFGSTIMQSQTTPSATAST